MTASADSHEANVIPAAPSKAPAIIRMTPTASRAGLPKTRVKNSLAYRIAIERNFPTGPRRASVEVSDMGGGCARLAHLCAKMR